MAKATWRIVALSALVGAVAPLAVAVPARAQMVIGGSGQPDVVVNWSVLDSLGQQPSLADMIKDELPGRRDAAPLVVPGARPPRAAAMAQGPVFKPYTPGKAKVAVAAKPAVVAEAEPVPIVPVAKPRVSEPKAKPAAPTKPQVAEAVSAPKGPQISLPEVKPAETAKPAEPVKPVASAEIAKPAKPPVPAVAAVAQLAAPQPVISPSAAPQPVISPSAAPQPVVSPSAAPQPVVSPSAAPQPVVAPSAAPQPVVSPSAAPQPVASTAILAPVPPPVSVMPPQVASLPSSEPPAVSGGDTISLAFDPDEAKLSDRARDSLAALVKRMQKDEDLNLQLLAYAAGDDTSASKARRLSLSRALEVRKVLMDKGVRSTRIEVRALGNKLDGRGAADRVDAVLVGR